MMVGVPLQFVKQVIRESMRSIPAMQDSSLFILSTSQFFSAQAIVLDIIDCL